MPASFAEECMHKFLTWNAKSLQYYILTRAPRRPPLAQASISGWQCTEHQFAEYPHSVVSVIPLSPGVFCGPEQAQRPESTLRRRSGSAVDMALLLASLLLGQGRDAHVVLGTCLPHAAGESSAISASATPDSIAAEAAAPIRICSPDGLLSCDTGFHAQTSEANMELHGMVPPNPPPARQMRLELDPLLNKQMPQLLTCAAAARDRAAAGSAAVPSGGGAAAEAHPGRSSAPLHACLRAAAAAASSSQRISSSQQQRNHQLFSHGPWILWSRARQCHRGGQLWSRHSCSSCCDWTGRGSPADCAGISRDTDARPKSRCSPGSSARQWKRLSCCSAGRPAGS